MEQDLLDFVCSPSFREIPPAQRHTEKKSTLPVPGRIAGEDEFALIHAEALRLIGPDNGGIK